MTKLVEDIIIKIYLDHCGGDSVVLGGKRDLRQEAAEYIADGLHELVTYRGKETIMRTPGVQIDIESMGLYEAPEEGGSDN